MRENFTLRLKKPPAAVFESLADFEKLAELSGGKVRLAPVPGKPRTGAGSAIMFETGNPQLGDFVCETTEWSPPNRAVRVFHLKDMPTTLSIRVEAEGSGSLLTVELELAPQTVMLKMALPLLAAQLKAGKEKALEQIQRQLDQ